MTASAHRRGYGSVHRRLRIQWGEQVDAGEVDCARCHKRIVPGTPWDLGHDDLDRRKYTGPEHRSCNRAVLTHRKAREDSGQVDPTPEPRTKW